MDNKNFDIKKLTLKQIRELNNLSQKEILKHLGLTDRTFRLKEQTKNEFTLSETRKLANLYKITLEEFCIILDNTIEFYNAKEHQRQL
jgi:transcriptional regulator with XRE-family HTH domain